MKQLNKNFLLFSFLALSLGICSLLLLYKVVPVFFLHTVYYCQQIFHAYSVQIPQPITLMLVGIIGLFVSSFFIKLINTVRKQYYFKRNFTFNNAQYKKIFPLLHKLDIQKHVSVITNAHAFAFCLGFRKPHIYVSTQTIKTMNTKELEAILWHEKYHLEHKDSLTMFIATISQFLFPFFPMITDLLEQYKIDREIRADNIAIQALGTKKPLISVLRKLLQYPTPSLLFASAIGDSRTLEARIHSLIKDSPSLPRIKKRNILLSIFSLGILILSIAIPVHATEVHTNMQDTMMVCLEGNNCATWCKEHNTVIPYSSSDNASHPYSSPK